MELRPARSRNSPSAASNPRSRRSQAYVHIDRCILVLSPLRAPRHYSLAAPRTRELTAQANVKSRARPALGFFVRAHRFGRRIIMKKRGLHSIGEIANDRLETIEDGVEACPEAADWEVAAEHRSIDAEAFDSMQCSATSR